MKNILLLSTGGTIASKTTDSGLMPKLSPKAMLELIPELKGMCSIETRELMNMDSTNIQPEEWQQLGRAIYQQLDNYDGFVITHGTDTMSYTAAALYYMLRGLNRPVILTGSQYPIDYEETDGKRNIYDAFVAAMDDRLLGVYIVFDGIIIDGLCAKKTRTRTYHAFESINRGEVGKVIDGRLILNKDSLRAVNVGEVVELKDSFDSHVMVFKLFPGMEAGYISLLGKAKELGLRGVVLEGFGLGGIPNVRRNLLPAISELIEEGIPVLLTTQCVYEGADMEVYNVGVKASKRGIVCGKDMTSEALVVGLMWALGQTSSYDTVIQYICDCRL